jgi:hypothetical protein
MFIPSMLGIQMMRQEGKPENPAGEPKYNIPASEEHT